MNKTALAAGFLACTTTFIHALSASFLPGWRHEAGVESKAIATLTAEHNAGPRIDLEAALGLSLFEHTGIWAYSVGIGFRFVPRPWVPTLRVVLQHEQWNGWHAGENRALVSLESRPVRRLGLALGLAYRNPVLVTPCYQSPVCWNADNPELALVYSLEWTFLQLRRLKTSLALSNTDRLHFHTPSHIPFQVHGLYDLAPDWSIEAHAATNVKGLSSLLFSVSEFSVEAGVRRAF